MAVRAVLLSMCAGMLVLAAGCSGASPGGSADVSHTPGSPGAPEHTGEPDTSAPDWDALRDRALAEEAESFGVDVPTDVEFVRYISPAEYGRVRADCMREQGFEARETFNGGVSYGEIPQEQGSAQRQASMRCAVMYPVHPRYHQPLNDEQLRATYDYYLDG